MGLIRNDTLLENARPDYASGNICNLMNSLVTAMGGSGAGTVLSALAPDTISRYRNVLLLIVDGMGHEFVKRFPGSYIASHINTPLTTVFPTTTATAISTYMSGLPPQQHGMTGWFTYLRALGSVAAVLPFRPRHGGRSFADSGIDINEIFTWQSVFDRIKRPGFALLPDYIVDSAYSRKGCGSARRVGYESLNGLFDSVGKVVKGGSGEKYIYAYWPGLDAMAHEFGIESEQVAGHFREIDRGVERMAGSLGGTDTLMLVCADHGLIDTTPERTIRLERHPVLARSLLLPLCGEPRVAYCYVAPGHEQLFVSYVENELNEQFYCVPSDALVDGGFFGPGPPHEDLKRRVGDYTLIARENYIIKDSVAGESEFQQIGVHGGLSDEERFVPLLILDIS
jgi:hypothetical protein